MGTDYKLAKLADRGGDLTKEWYIYYWFRNPDTSELERIRIKGGINQEKTAAARTRVAKALMSALNKMLQSGWSPWTSEYHVPGNLTITAAFELALRHKEGTVSKKTHSEYRIAWNKLKAFLESKKLQHFPASTLTDRHILQLRDQLVAKGLAAKTINTGITHLRTLWGVLLDHQEVKVNIFTRVKDLREVEGNKNVPLTDEELAKVSAHLQAKHPGLLLLCRFIYGSAVRPLECLGIRRKHIDFDLGILKLPGTISKNNRTQVVDLPEQLLEMLRAIGFDKADTELLLFTTNKLVPGTKVTHRNRVSDLWKQLVRVELGIDKDMYSLKHKGAIDLVNANVDIKKIQVYMRHSSLQITDQYLRTLTGQRLEAVRNRQLAL